MATGSAMISARRRVAALLGHERRLIWVAVIYAMGVGLLSLAIPVGVQAFVNTVAFGQLRQPVIVLALLVLVGLGFAGAMRGLQTFVVEIIQRRLFARVALEVATRLPRARVEKFDGAHAPELVNRFFDVLTVQKSAALLLLDGVGLVLSTVIGLVLLAIYHPILLVFGLVLGGAVALVVFVLGRGAATTSIEESYAKYRVAAWLEELARHSATWRSRAGTALAEARAEELTRDWVAKRRAHFRVVFRQVMGSVVLQAVASAALLGIGGYLVVERQLTLGQLVAAELIVTAVLSNVAKFGKYLEATYDLVAAADKLGYLLDLPLERDERAEAAASAPVAHDARGAALRLDGVRFAYRGRDQALLDGATLEVAPGARVALLGPSGAGKSTLAALLDGRREPHSGRVDVDGLDTRDWPLEALRDSVVVVRGAELFEGTIEDNVSLGREGVDARVVREALERVGVWATIAAFPDGMRTEILPGGAPLSAGDAQRVAVARALAGRPRLVVIDELVGLDAQCRRELLSLLASCPGFTLLYLGPPEDAGLLPRTLFLDGGRLIDRLAA